MLPWLRDLRPREADPEQSEFHLLELLSAPLASIVGHRVAVWVYWEEQTAREIVISGHAEPATCSRVSAAVLETVRLLDGQAEWMLTAGAGYLRLPLTLSTAGFEAVAEMLDTLEDIARTSGLVRIQHAPAALLASSQRAIRTKGDTSDTATILLPEVLPRHHIGGYLPFVLENGSVFSFRLSGWHYDCPEFQNIADHHLRALSRSFIEDALRRRSAYRLWLSEWMREWILDLHHLNEAEATGVQLELPADRSQKADAPVRCTADVFLRQHASAFTAAKATWPDELRYLHGTPYRPKSDAELDTKRRPDRITAVNFDRCERTERRATDSDGLSKREETTRHMPALISTCLRWLTRMAEIIAPYEQLATRRSTGEYSVMDAISRRMLLDTMIRGWPSFYLDNPHDRLMFARWSQRCRSRVWTTMLRAGVNAGINEQALREDCVVFNVDFDRDLGCRITPLALFDNKSHVILRGSNGMSGAVIPLWPQRRVNRLPRTTGMSNSALARQLVGDAIALADRGAPAFEIAARLRTALTWHAVDAGQRIIDEWRERLGSWDSGATEGIEVLESCELLSSGDTVTVRRRYGKVPHEVPSDGLLILAIAEAMDTGNTGADYHRVVQEREMWLRESVEDHNGQRAWLETASLLKWRESIQALQAERLHVAGKLIARALNDAELVRSTHPALASAAVLMPDYVRALLPASGDSVLSLRTIVGRYANLLQTAHARRLLRTFMSFNDLAYAVGEDANAWRAGLRSLVEVSGADWLPSTVADSIDVIVQEVSLGISDVLHSQSLRAGLIDAAHSCFSSANELFRRQSAGVPPLDAIVLPIHVDLTFNHAFQRAFESMLKVTVPLGRLTAGQWSVIDPDGPDVPGPGQIRFDASTGIVSLMSEGAPRALMRIDGVRSEELGDVAVALATIDLSESDAMARAQIAERILASRVAPAFRWQRWRDALGQVREEMTCVFGSFSASVSVWREYTPTLTDAGLRATEMLESTEPKDVPTLDHEWRDMGPWARVVKGSPSRTQRWSTGVSS